MQRPFEIVGGVSGYLRLPLELEHGPDGVNRSVWLDLSGTHRAVHKRDCSVCQNADWKNQRGSPLICAPGFCAPVASTGAAEKLKGPACPSSTTGLVMKKRAVCLATSCVVEAQTSTRISASYRTTDPGLPEPADLFRGCLGLRLDSMRRTRSASEGDTPRMRASLEGLGTVS